MQHSIDLNCDLGEYSELSEGVKDAAIMPFISSCNIACGAHAGNVKVIEQTIAWAKENQVNIGAHPSFPDRANFGRKIMYLPASELRPILHDQLMMIKESASSLGLGMAHVKPHGALYNQAAIDLKLALLLAEVIADIDDCLMFYGLAHSKMAQAAQQIGLVFVAEGFADRAYTVSKTLHPRGEAGAVIHGAEEMLQRVVGLFKTGCLTTVSGENVAIQIDTLCLHGDHENAESTAKVLHHGLTATGIQINAPDVKMLQCQQFENDV